MPVSWKVLYSALLCIAIARLLFEAFCPTIVRPPRERSTFAPTRATRQFLKQQLREIYQWLRSSRRRNHFLLDFIKHFVANADNVASELPSSVDAPPLERH